MNNNTIGTHRGTPSLTAFDPIKEKPGSAAYNAVSGPGNTIRGVARPFTRDGASYNATTPTTDGHPYASLRLPSVPRRQYIPTITL